MKLKLLIIAALLSISAVSVQASTGSIHRTSRSDRERIEVSGMLSTLSERVEGKVPAGKVLEKFMSLRAEDRTLILSLYRQMERSESETGREIAISLIMALIVLS